MRDRNTIGAWFNGSPSWTRPDLRLWINPIVYEIGV